MAAAESDRPTLHECQSSINTISTLSVYNQSQRSEELSAGQRIRLTQVRMEVLQDLNNQPFVNPLKTKM